MYIVWYVFNIVYTIFWIWLNFYLQATACQYTNKCIFSNLFSSVAEQIM
jgi:hypothetical protein